MISSHYISISKKKIYKKLKRSFKSQLTSNRNKNSIRTKLNYTFHPAEMAHCPPFKPKRAPFVTLPVPTKLVSTYACHDIVLCFCYYF